MLHLHRSERADALVEALAELLAVSLPNPFAPEVVAVPARGVERWLTQRLSHHLGARPGDADGVCANVWFPSPAQIVADATSRATGVAPGDDPWADGRVVWTLLDVIDGCAQEPWCSVLGRHLGADSADGLAERGRRLLTAEHIAGLYASYGAQRPQILRDWAEGKDADGDGLPLERDLAWQAELWRRLRTAVAAPSPAERLDAACQALREQPTLVELPSRLSLFGPTRMTADQIAVLDALADHRDVHLWLLHPSAVLWEKTGLEIASADEKRRRPRRRTDPTVDIADHPLLLSLGRDAREMQVLLGAEASPSSDQYHPGYAEPETLLGGLQHGIRADAAPPGAPLGRAVDARAVLDPKDRSLQVHACHGRDRQVEVLREILLGLLEGDPTLEPRDVLVMCPDIETYAPYISATFGLADSDEPPAHPGHSLRVRLADRSLRQTNPLLSTVGELLELADARVTASQVLDLAAVGPVRRRFRFDEDDLDRVRGWVIESGVRWGFDADHRAAFRMQGVVQNTWRAGLDRVLLGVTMSEDDLRWLGLALPLDDVDSSDVNLVGRFSEFVDRLTAVLDALTGSQPLARWLTNLTDALDALTDVSPRDSWQSAQVHRELTDIVSEAGQRAQTVTLTLPDVRALLAERLKGRPTRAGFRTGDLTMCSMVPMRSVPHRVICLLGLDDTVFPRTTGVDGDDILARDPCVGERDRRSEDRQLLLDAIHAAQEYLVIVYTGADDRTNTERPPAVPVGEILDVVDACVRTDDGVPARDRVVVRHPLQPFDDRNFTPGRLGTPGPFSFDRSALAGARAAGLPRLGERAFLSDALPAVGTACSVDLKELISFLEHPVKQFLRRRLGVSAPEEEDELDDALHAELDGLQHWAIGDRWLRARLDGAAVTDCAMAEWRRGALPPGTLGERLLEEIKAQAEPLLAASAADRTVAASGIDVALPMADGRILVGTVPGVHGRTLCTVVFSKLAPKQRLRSWVQLLALAATRRDEAWQAVTVGRHRRPGVARSVLRAPPADEAAATLAVYVELLDRGLREPLPLPLAAACKYVEVRRLGRSTKLALGAAGKEWTGSFEQADPQQAFVWGPRPRFDTILAQPAPTDWPAAGAAEPENTWFGTLARRLWWPLLDAETLKTP